MSTEQHKPSHAPSGLPTHGDVSFESKDVQTGKILGYMLYLALTVVVTFIISFFIWRATTSNAIRTETPLPPVRQGAGVLLPPEPRLQGVPGHLTDPQQDLRDKTKADTEANKELKWVDQKAGIAQIPVEEAMKIIAKKGLPAVAPALAEKKK